MTDGAMGGSGGARVLRALTEDGVCLGIRHFPRVGERRAVCLCAHAMMANGRYFAPGGGGGFVGHLRRAGVDVYVLDWRGHGLSPMPGTHPGWYFDDYVERDAPAAIRRTCEHAGIEARELGYVGHSLGGLVALAALGTGAIPRLGALGLFATSVWLPGPGGDPWRRALMSALALASRPLGRAPVRALGFGPEDEPRSYLEQIARWTREGRWSSRSGVDYLAQLGRVEVPTWAAVGLGDRLCRPVDADALRARLADAAPLVTVGRATGFAVDADHFGLLTDEALAPLWDEWLGFLDRHVGRRR